MEVEYASEFRYRNAPINKHTLVLAITQSGTPAGYRVYDGRGVTIDVRHLHDSCITINASYVVVRGFTLKGAGAPAVHPAYGPHWTRVPEPGSVPRSR